jgi:hypothetical protein
MSSADSIIETRLKHLESHLEQENPVLLNAVQSFRVLDKVAYRMGLMERHHSYAQQIAWWPLISLLGTFSSGKSTFINHYLGFKLQRTGTQAVDDKFTVICYSKEQDAHALPGVALDADPRFPFYRISNEIEKVAKGEGQRIDSYLQLKTCPSEQLRGKILIDSPGFDADAQRTSTLRITDHIMDLADLVLVFFDARHPEPGAMQDTLEHLVSNTLHRSDAGKFLYILNQLDTTAREDNPEEVVAAWQRALGERGLTAGRFYTIYNPDAAVPIEDESRRRRFESKRDADLSDIHGRMRQVEIERAYRIIGALEKNARDIGERQVPAIMQCIERWRRRVLIGDAVVFGLLAIAVVIGSIKLGWWDGLSFSPPWLETLASSPWLAFGSAGAVLVLIIALHYLVRSAAAGTLKGMVARLGASMKARGDLALAFRRNTRPWRSIFASTPAGWGRLARKRLRRVLEDADTYVQALNDKFTNPSGEELALVHVAPPIPPSPEQSTPPPETAGGTPVETEPENTGSEERPSPAER